MGRILTLIGLLVGISCTSALTVAPTSVAPTSVAPTSSMSLAPSMTTTSLVPSVSPSPAVPFFPESDYNVTVDGKPKGKVCIRMVGNITLQVQYPRNETGKVKNDTLMLDVSGRAAVDRTLSSCTNGSQMNGNGTMHLRWDNTSNYGLIFFFKEDKDNWSLDKIQFQFLVYDNNDFENYTLQNQFNGTLNATDTTTVFTNEFERSYRCVSSQSNNLNISKDTQLMVTLTTTNWQVQAFAFPKGNDNGSFTNDRRCTADISSSKIVPIAVGAALAGLVVVVLVAYLIGRFKNRKQNSYEALS